MCFLLIANVWSGGGDVCADAEGWAVTFGTVTLRGPEQSGRARVQLHRSLSGVTPHRTPDGPRRSAQKHARDVSSGERGGEHGLACSLACCFAFFCFFAALAPVC